MAEQKRGYSAVFWEIVRWMYEMQAVSDVKLCADVGIDRKSLRKKRDDEGWQRRPIYPAFGHYIHDGETAEQLKLRYAHGLTRALAFKTGEWNSIEELYEAAGPRGVSAFLADRAERRHG